jgi:glycine oxidase
MADVVVVGGGVIGCAVAYYLTAKGARVTLLERDEVAGHASGAAAGMLVPPAEAVTPGPFRDFCQAGAGAYPPLVEALRDETGIDVQYLDSGILLVAATEERARVLMALAGTRPEMGWHLEWVEGEALRRLEPALSDSIIGAAYSLGDRHVNPGLLTQALAASARSNGATIRQDVAITGFDRRGGRVRAIRTSDGGRVSTDHVVLAAGSWTGRLARRLGGYIPTRPVRGQMLAYRSNALRHVVWGEEGYLVPKAGGFVFAGATVEDVGFRPSTTHHGLAWLRRMAASMAPRLRYAEVASTWAGLRPGSPDGHPIIGRLPGHDNVVVATGHFRNGILLGPITGKLVADLVLDGRADPLIEPFGPARFVRETAG